jgi:hypothetical protein
MPRSSLAGSYSSTTLATNSDRSTGSRATVPVSASAMRSSASKVLRM